MSGPEPKKPAGDAPGLSYREAGVDIDAGDALVERIKPLAAKTRRAGVLGGIGGFGALFQLPAGLREPVLVSGTDGVGTKLKLAFLHARRALNRAFSGHIRFSLDGGARRRAEALVLISPLISKAMVKCDGLEAAAMNPSDAAQAFRLAAHALFDDWRHDSNVTTRPARWIGVAARSKIPAVIDGEPMLLGREAAVTFQPRAFRALAPRPPAGEDSL